jgi:hypothetical protein
MQNTDRNETNPYLQERKMKRRIQFVALLVAGLLAVQPALAALPCIQGTPVACVAGCPMNAAGMGPDCHMAGKTAAGNCPQSCCSQALPRVLAPLAAPKQLHPSTLVSPSALSFAVSGIEPSLAVLKPISVWAASPSHYLLNRAFRI